MAIIGTPGSDTLTGSNGADTFTGGGGTDTFVFAPGGSPLTIGGTGTGGTISGFDVITDFQPGSTAAGSEIIQFAGAKVVGTTTSTNGDNSTLRLNTNAVVSSHRVTNGI